MADPSETIRRSAMAPRTARRTERVPLAAATPQPFGIEGIDFEAAAGRARGARRTVRVGQDHHDLPDPAAVRRRRGRRSRSTARTSARSPSQSLGSVIGFVTQETYLFHASVRDNLLYRQARGDAGGAGGRRAGRGDPRARHGAAGRLRHDRRRTRLQAVGRREAADRDRPGAPQGPADPDPRRGDLGPRHRQRAADPGCAREARPRAHDHRDRAPPVDDPASRPDPRLRPRAESSRAASHAELLALNGLYARLYHEQFEGPRKTSVAPEPTADEGGRTPAA